ncbi:PilZ domain-containing protein [Geomesophilobacter sediminis]|uniref:PilZ domain-containing protein n=1 Tax=Geomesophilobacter sediminis TaxID=2798584 RepID=A0A8J7SD45_9BACT|nr:PilZ domain-containing protein [Geomesophilobacter sediminis]MBJ6727604.1 PilZ domain-containing protein [Geomesophilobacter sediminis]
MYKEKRNFARLALHAKANLLHQESVHEGEVENLSMKGVFIKTQHRIDIDDTVAVTIYHSLTPHVLCDLKAKVIRVTDQGVGLQFEKTLLD